ncbi:MAG: NAD(P)H-hydrate dehydratase [Lachnospiraceae bacterium]|nr:NAD(P)H-hydrate dehydratase [Lachnospiraceae bacterium]
MEERIDMDGKVRYLVTAEEMKAYDRNTTERIGVPGMVLMERAALAALEYLLKRWEKGSALILAGVGNNGGDGLALARLLAEKGWQTEVWCVGDKEKATEQWKSQRHILDSYPVRFSSVPERNEYTIMVDALFGAGLSREITGEYARAVEEFQERRGFKLALDIPSGVDADTGKVRGTAVRADATVTFGFQKRGLGLYPGCDLAGEIVTAHIGITERSFFGREPETFTFAGEPESLLPERAGDGNKGAFGKVLLAAGSVNMAGAAVLAAKAAYRTGAGMVKVISPEENRTILQTAVPEALFGTPWELSESLEWADSVIIGPGIGKSQSAMSSLRQVLKYGRKPLVIDADGLNLLAEDGGLRQLLEEQGAKGRSVVLTPHVGELSRLAGVPVPELKQSLLTHGKGLAERFHVIVTAKDARTFVCREQGSAYLNLCGNSGMATAGSGDVLAGITGTLLAQMEDAFTAAALAVYLHGRAGDAAAAQKGRRGCMAGDIAEALTELE